MALVLIFLFWVGGVFEGLTSDEPPPGSIADFLQDDKVKKNVKKNSKPMPASSSLDNFIDSLTKKSEEHSITGAIAGLIWYFGALLVIGFAIWIFSMILSGPLEM